MLLSSLYSLSLSLCDQCVTTNAYYASVCMRIECIFDTHHACRWDPMCVNIFFSTTIWFIHTVLMHFQVNEWSLWKVSRLIIICVNLSIALSEKCLVMFNWKRLDLTFYVKIAIRQKAKSQSERKEQQITHMNSFIHAFDNRLSECIGV